MTTKDKDVAIERYRLFLITINLEMAAALMQGRDPALTALGADKVTQRKLGQGIKRYQAIKALRAGEPIISWYETHLALGNIDPVDATREGVRRTQ